MTWKFVEICYSTYRHNIHVESTSIRRGVLVGLLYFIVIIVITIIVLSIINVIYFILSHFVSFCSYYYDFCFVLRVTCMCPFFSPLLLMTFILQSHCLYMSRIIFLQPLSFISSLSSSQPFYFFQHYQSLGQNSANEFEWHGLPLPIDYFE